MLAVYCYIVFITFFFLNLKYFSITIFYYISLIFIKTHHSSNDVIPISTNEFFSIYLSILRLLVILHCFLYSLKAFIMEIFKNVLCTDRNQN